MGQQLLEGTLKVWNEYAFFALYGHDASDRYGYDTLGSVCQS